MSYAAEFSATWQHCRTKGQEEEAPPTYSPSLIWAGESYIMVGNYYLLISNKINVASARTRLSGSADDASARHHPRTSFLVKVAMESSLSNRPMKFSTKS